MIITGFVPNSKLTADKIVSRLTDHAVLVFHKWLSDASKYQLVRVMSQDEIKEIHT